MAHWTWRTYDLAGNAVSDLLDGTGRKATFSLSAPSTLEWSTTGDARSAAQIGELTHDIVVSRDGVNMARFRVGSTEDTLDETAHTVKWSAVDYRGVLARRFVWPGSTTSYTGVDQASIAWDLIADTQTLGTLGVTNGSVATGRVRDRVYEPGKQIAEAIQQLAEVIDGFDWDIDAGRVFRVYYPQRGTVRDFAAVWGQTVSRITRTVDTSSYASDLYVTGGDALAGVTRHVAAPSTGRWEDQVGYPDVTVASTLAEKADADIASRSVWAPAYKATLKRGRWSPADLWLGDSCRVVVRSGRLTVDEVLRAVQFEVDIGDDGDETVAVTFGRVIPTTLDRLRTVEADAKNLKRKKP